MFDEAVSDGLYPAVTARAQRVIGADLSVRTLQASRLQHPDLKTVCADVRQLPLQSQSFDVVVSPSTLDHFDSPQDLVAALAELYRILKPSGHLLVTLDNLANPLIALRNALPFGFVRRLGLVPYYVGASFGPRRLRFILNQLGFEVVELETSMHCPRILAVAVARSLERCSPRSLQERFVRFLMAFECFSKWPTRFLTGHFVAAKAVKRQSVA